MKQKLGEVATLLFSLQKKTEENESSAVKRMHARVYTVCPQCSYIFNLNCRVLSKHSSLLYSTNSRLEDREVIGNSCCNSHFEISHCEANTW